MWTAPLQTEVQRLRIAEAAGEAVAASASASESLRSYFDSSSFRAHLRSCCPEVAALGSEQLLGMFADEIAATEVTHNFPVSGGNGLTLDSLEQAPWLYNDYQLKALRLRSSWPGEPQVTAEQGIYGLAAAAGRAPTWDESSSRGVYAAVNWLRLDMGVEHYGELALVLSPQLARSAMLVAAADSGIWELQCNRTPPRDYPVDCQALPAGDLRRLGTLSHANHLALSGSRFWHATEVPLIELLFSRWFGRRTQRLRYADLRSTYLEGLLLANAPLPASAHLVIASLPKLFGTTAGTRLRAFCRRHGRVLAWALGANLPVGHSFWEWDLSATVAVDTRVLDTATSHFVDVSASRSANASFERAWHEAQSAREARGASAVAGDSAFWASLYARIDVFDASLRVRPMSFEACGHMHLSADNCIGASLDQRCVCYRAPAAVTAPAKVAACVDTPKWHNRYKADCDRYVIEGHCFGGGAAKGHEWALGAEFDYPERSCCACGKGRTSAGTVVH